MQSDFTFSNEEAALSTLILSRLSSSEKETEILDCRTEIQKRHRSLLLESGQVWVKLAQGEAVDSTRRTLLNQCLNLTEVYLTCLECALSNLLYIRQLLDLSSNSVDMQQAAPYHQMLEEMMYVQIRRGEKMIADCPELVFLVKPNVCETVLKPFQSICIFQGVGGDSVATKT